MVAASRVVGVVIVYVRCLVVVLVVLAIQKIMIGKTLRIYLSSYSTEQYYCLVRVVVLFVF